MIVYVIMKLIFYTAKTRKKIIRIFITLEKLERYGNLIAQHKIIRVFTYNDAMSFFKYLLEVNLGKFLLMLK